jgi:hypothetical protein
MVPHTMNCNVLRAFSPGLFLFLIISCLTGCSMGSLDDNKKDLSLAEAQELVSFKICLPSYLPAKTDPNPSITYYADYGDSPEKYIVLQYKMIITGEHFIDIWQRYDSGAEKLKNEYDDDVHEAWKYQLIYWIIPSNTRQAEALFKRASVEHKAFESQTVVWWLYELVEPIEYQSTLTRWNKDNMRYEIFSILTPEEINEVTMSMFECSQ